MQLSDAGARLIESFEGWSSKPYWDSYGHVWTIGYGFTSGVTSRTPPMTKQQGHERLKREVTNTYGAAINRLSLPLSQPMFDALTSFVFNVGTGGVGSGTTVGRELRAHRWQAAANGLLAWNKAGGKVLAGLTRRREAERAMFLGGVGQPPGKPTPKPVPVVQAVPGKIPMLWHILRRGSKFPAVRVLQRHLHDHGHPALKVDGIYGPATEATVRQFQKNHKLAVDGVVGAQTWKTVFGA